MACAICQVRRSKRFCPGVRGDICTICCGTEREVTVACPLDCEYLQDARRHERAAPPDPEQIPNRDIKVGELVNEHPELIIALARTLTESALKTPGVTDFDMRDALDALIRTHRTLQSGIYYETRPANALAGEIFRDVQRSLEEFRTRERQEQGLSKTRDSQILRALVFFQLLELDRNNSRRKSRAFIDLLRGFHPAKHSEAGAIGSSLIVP
jgi:hypothetical protein